MRLRITLNLCESGIFLYEGYQDELLLYFRHLFDTEHVGVTDFLSPRKIGTDKGIWLVSKANLIVCSPFLRSSMREIMSLPGKKLNIQGNGLAVDNVKICRHEMIYEGILLSGVFSHAGGSCLEYEKSPELFSEHLRLNLIEVYRAVNNLEEPEDKRFFISLSKGYRKQYILGKPVYKGIFEIFGSPGLCGIFNQCFVTGKFRDKNSADKEMADANISERG